MEKIASTVFRKLSKKNTTIVIPNDQIKDAILRALTYRKFILGDVTIATEDTMKFHSSTRVEKIASTGYYIHCIEIVPHDIIWAKLIKY